ncbi:unnamed protein product, partial [marine sediment metagenome]
MGVKLQELIVRNKIEFSELAGTIFKYIFNTIGTLFLVLGTTGFIINVLKVFGK